MVDKTTTYSDSSSTNVMGWLQKLTRNHYSYSVLLTILVSVYIVGLPLMYAHMGLIAGTFVSIPVVAFAYLHGVRYGLTCWFLLGIVANGVLLNLLGAGSDTPIITQGQISGQTVLFLVTIMIGRLRDLATHSMQQAEQNTQKQVRELEDSNRALKREITQYEQIIAQLQARFDKQEQTTGFRSRMSMMTSHEFRTPLSLIMTSSEILRNSYHQLTNAQQQRYFDTIHKQVDHLTALSDEVIALAKAETQTPRHTVDLLDIESFCQEIITTFQMSHQSTHTFSYDSIGMFREVQIDRKFAQQIVTNLLSNAVKYSPSGGEISIALLFQENEFVIRIQDQGVGIPDEDVDHLFDLFHRGQNADIAPGTGLGLVIVKQAVEANGGTIHVDSKIGIGTVFTIRLPG